jgi:hypothetical protein
MCVVCVACEVCVVRVVCVACEVCVVRVVYVVCVVCEVCVACVVCVVCKVFVVCVVGSVWCIDNSLSDLAMVLWKYISFLSFNTPHHHTSHHYTPNYSRITHTIHTLHTPLYCTPPHYTFHRRTHLMPPPVTRPV